MAKPPLSPAWALYYRVSNEDRQHPENSIPAQRRDVTTRLVIPSGLSVYREYIDLESGKTAERDQFQEMLEDAAQGRFSHLGFQKWERFGRNLRQALEAEERLTTLGVQIQAANMAGLDATTSGGWLTKSVQQLIAEWYNRQLGEVVVDRMKIKLERGEWCWTAPDGYLYKREYLNSKKHRSWLELDPQRSPLVTSLFQRFCTGHHTLRTLAAELNAEGYREASGGDWTHHAIHRLLHNEFYAGWCISRRWGIRVRGQHPPLVDQETWDACQDILRRQRQQPQSSRRVYPLGRLLWSHELQARFYSTTCHGERCDPLPYYYTLGKLDGRRIYVQARVVEAQIPGLLARICVPAEQQEQLRREYAEHLQEAMEHQWQDERERLQRQATTLERELTNLLRLATKEMISDEEFARLRTELQTELQTVQARLHNFTRGKIEQINRMDQALSLLGHAPDLWPRLSPADQRSLAELVFRRITINKEGHVQHAELWPPLDWLVSHLSPGGSRIVVFGTPNPTPLEPLTWPAPALLPALSRLLA